MHVCMHSCVTETYLVQASCEIYHNLARSVIINDLKLPNVACNNVIKCLS